MKGDRAVLSLLAVAFALVPAVLHASAADNEDAIDIGSRRELFVDDLLIGELSGLRLKLHEPRQLPPELIPPCNQGHYATVIKDGDLYRLYSRAYKVPQAELPADWEQRHLNEVYLYSESQDGLHWVEPDLGIYKIEEFPKGNVVLADVFLVTHNFSPFIDERPGVPAGERYKALGGLPYRGHHLDVRDRRNWPGGLYALVSSDAIHWKLFRDKPVIPDDYGAFDSQNVAFWSVAEGQYVCYFRVFRNGLRSISRSTSKDFVEWTAPVAMEANAPGEHLYTNGTHPYFRAPHIYVALPTRYQADRGSITDIVFMSARPGENHYNRPFKEAFIRPGLGKGGWGNRSNYAAWHVVPTSDSEMSIYLHGGRHYTLRYDGFISVHAGFKEGEFITKPLRFAGDRLEINYSTSAAGMIRVEIQDAKGRSIEGFSLDDSEVLYGDEIRHVVNWKGGPDLGDLSGQTVRLRFVMNEADLYSLRFFEPED